jgi:hypothetical protein
MGMLFMEFNNGILLMTDIKGIYGVSDKFGLTIVISENLKNISLHFIYTSSCHV